MNISPAEAEEALTAIQMMMQKTRRAISSSGAYNFLIVWGAIWMVGFLTSQFLTNEIAGYAWAGLDVLGGILSAVIGLRMNRGVRTSAPTTSGKRIAIFWLLLFFFCASAIAIARPVDGKQFAMFIILFVTVGWIAMGLLLSFASVWWGLALLGVSLVSYFFLNDYFYFIMAFVGGGGMIVLGIYVRNRW